MNRTASAALSMFAVLVLSGCPDETPGQPVNPPAVPPVDQSAITPREGDQCQPGGAVVHTGNGVTLQCGRWNGRDYNTWGKR